MILYTRSEIRRTHFHIFKHVYIGQTILWSAIWFFQGEISDFLSNIFYYYYCSYSLIFFFFFWDNMHLAARGQLSWIVKAFFPKAHKTTRLLIESIAKIIYVAGNHGEGSSAWHVRNTYAWPLFLDCWEELGGGRLGNTSQAELAAIAFPDFLLTVDVHVQWWS